MVERFKKNEKLLAKVAEIYEWLGLQLSKKLTDECDACGRCCDFAAFNHRLYVTVPEIMYMAANLNVNTLKLMPSGLCPYNIDRKCTVYEYRFSGCRIFNCKADADVQSELSESVLAKFKAICLNFQIHYRYMDLASALNGHGSI